jgi:serine/threonine protein kinase
MLFGKNWFLHGLLFISNIKFLIMCMYMFKSPEAVLNKNYSNLRDIWSVSMIIYEFAYGKFVIIIIIVVII